MTVAELTARVSVVGTEPAKRALEGLGKSARSFGEAIRSAADATRLLEIATNALTKISGIEAAMSYDAQVRGLAAYQKNAKDLEAQLARLIDIAKLPGLGLPEVAQGVLSLEAAGLSAQMSERAIKAFGNALALAGRGKAELDGVILALGQIASKGKISAEEINQMAERVPQIRQALQKAFGTSSTEAIQKMGISANEAIGKIIAAMEELPKATTGFRVTFENLGDAFNAMVRPIGRGLLDIFQASSDTGGRLIDTLTRMTTAIGEVLSAVAKSGAVQEMFSTMFDSAMQFGKGWQVGLANAIGATMAFVGNVPSLWRAMVADLEGFWSTFTENLGIGFRNTLRDMVGSTATAVADIASLLGLKGIAANITTAMAPEERRSYTANTQGAVANMILQMMSFQKGIISNLGPQGLPQGLITGGGAATKAGAAAADADKKAKDTQKTLQRIESNTRRSADALDLRTQTIGGGQLGRLGVTGTELAGMGVRTQNEISRAKPISSDTMVTRGIKQMIQNNLSFAVNGGRSLPVR